MRQQSMRKHPHRLAALLLCLALWAGLLVPPRERRPSLPPDPPTWPPTSSSLGCSQGVSEGAADFVLDRTPTGPRP